MMNYPLRIIVCLSLLFLSLPSIALVEVGFFSAVPSNPFVEPNKNFVHVAIRFKGQWLSAMPYHGVYLADGFNHYYHVTSIFIHDRENLKESDYAIYLEREFKYWSDWDDETSTSCSKLVGQILGLTPKPMESVLWVEGSNKRAMGLSPDEVFEALTSMGYKSLGTCVDELSDIST